MRAVVVLQKPMHRSKTRLTGWLSDEQRFGLVHSMLYDVLNALSKVPSLDQFSIMTCDPNAIKLAKNFGANIYYERSVSGMNHAVKSVVDVLDSDVNELIILLSDIPLVSVEELNSIMTQKKEAPVTIFPCKKGTGTNGLMLSPPKVINAAFGENSMEKHLAKAKHVGCEYQLGHAPLLSYDIDTIKDLRYVKEMGKGTKTYQYIHEQCILEKTESAGVR
jgi:2-phospho-L-lactate guanylyltransferase